jgi:multisubunit Na+/H+ antiporter MnhF subunit
MTNNRRIFIGLLLIVSMVLLITEPTFFDKPSEIDTIGPDHTFGVLILGIINKYLGIIPIILLFGIIGFCFLFVAYKKSKEKK